MIYNVIMFAFGIYGISMGIMVYLHGTNGMRGSRQPNGLWDALKMGWFPYAYPRLKEYKIPEFHEMKEEARQRYLDNMEKVPYVEKYRTKL